MSCKRGVAFGHEREVTLLSVRLLPSVPTNLVGGEAAQPDEALYR